MWFSNPLVAEASPGKTKTEARPSHTKSYPNIVKNVESKLLMPVRLTTKLPEKYTLPSRG